MRILNYFPKLAFLVLTGWAVSGAAVETSEAEPARFCLPLMTIKTIKIIDNQHIAFQTRNDDFYLNELPYTCPTLSRERAIMYSTPLNSLCSLDIITVLDDIGGGFQSMGSCGLGKFRPASKADIQLLKDKKTTE